MDPKLYHIAHKVAVYEKILEDSKPNYTKILNILNQQVKNSLKDLIESIKNEDEETTVHLLHMILGQIESIFKYMDLIPFKNKLKNLVDKEFSE